MSKIAGTTDHPPAGPTSLSPDRRIIAIDTLLLFMPSWIRLG